jgi:hypothetical protein
VHENFDEGSQNGRDPRLRLKAPRLYGFVRFRRDDSSSKILESVLASQAEASELGSLLQDFVLVFFLLQLLLSRQQGSLCTPRGACGVSITAQGDVSFFVVVSRSIVEDADIRGSSLPS